MIQNIIFDFGNVLARFSPEEMTAAYIQDPEDIRIACEVIFDRLYWDRLDDGTITDEEVIAGICSRLPARLHGDACRVYREWIELLPPIPGMQELVRDIRAAGRKLYLLSNISIGFAENYSSNPWVGELFSLFDGLVFSAPLGITKPHREIFGHLLQHHGLRAEDCIFIDDSPRNIAGCEAAGIRGYLFREDADALRSFLQIPRRDA